MKLNQRILFLVLVSVGINVNAMEDSLFTPLLNTAPEAFVVSATRFAAPPVVDGRLDDSCWMTAERHAVLFQYQPIQESMASESTLFAFGYDSRALYFAAWCFDSEPARVLGKVRARDALAEDDIVEIVLDCNGNGIQAFTFDINPVGSQADGVQTTTDSDDSWDGIWTAAGKRTDVGWQVEAAIPFSNLRYSGGDSLSWRFQIVRLIQRKAELSTFVPIRVSDGNILERMGVLTGLEMIASPQRLSFLPYLTNRYTHIPGIPTDDQLDFGLDLKYALQSNVTFDATYNPDFGEVEADIENINLSPYRLYLPEKRSFFLEKMDIFQTPFQLFYSRTIEDPGWGGKLSGSLGPYGFGALVARDNAIYGPENQFFAARVQRVLFTGSFVGLMTTLVDNDMRRNLVVATDWNIPRSPLTWSGQLARSHTTGLDALTWKGTTKFGLYWHNIAAGYRYSFHERNFYADAGFVYPLVIDMQFTPFSYRTHEATIQYDWFANRTGVRCLTPYARHTVQKDYEGRLLVRNTSMSLSVSLVKRLDFGLSSDFDQRLWEGQYFDSYSLGFSASWNPRGHFGVYASYSEGKQLDYWSVTTVWQKYGYFGFTWRAGTSLEIIPLVYYVSQYEYQHGPKTYEQWNESLRLTYNFTKNLFIKTFLQRDGYRNIYSANFLAGYTFYPGSTAYLALNTDYLHEEDNFNLQNRVILLKCSYWLPI